MAAQFDGNTIQNDNYHITDIDHYSLPNKSLRLYGVANANKSAIPDTQYPDKGIKITGYIRCDSSDSLEGYIDTFKSYFWAKDANLDLDYDGGTRRYIATVSKLDISRTDSPKAAKFTIDFVCTQPFGRATSTNSLLSAAGRTSASYNDSITVLGNAKYQLPIITITINSVTDGDAHIFVSNNATGQGILIVGPTFAASDEIVINCQDRTVEVNGVGVDYSGSFPEFETGSQQIDYEDGFTARNFDIDVDQYAYYL